LRDVNCVLGHGHSASHRSSSSKSSSHSKSKSDKESSSKSSNSELTSARSPVVIDLPSKNDKKSAADKKPSKRESTSHHSSSSHKAAVDPVLAVVHSVKPAAAPKPVTTPSSSTVSVSTNSDTAASVSHSSVVFSASETPNSLPVENNSHLAGIDLLPSLTQIIATLAATIEQQRSPAGTLPADAGATLTSPPPPLLPLPAEPAVGNRNLMAPQLQRVTKRPLLPTPNLPAFDMNPVSNIIGSATSLALATASNSANVLSSQTKLSSPVTISQFSPRPTPPSNSLSAVPPSALQNLNVDSNMLSKILSQFNGTPTSALNSDTAQQSTTGTSVSASVSAVGNLSFGADTMSNLLQTANLDLLKSAVAAVNKEQTTVSTLGSVSLGSALVNIDTDLLRSAVAAATGRSTQWSHGDLAEDDVENACYYLPVVKDTKDIVIDTVRALYDGYDIDSDDEPLPTIPQRTEVNAALDSDSSDFGKQQQVPYTSDSLTTFSQQKTTLPFLGDDSMPQTDTFESDNRPWIGAGDADRFLPGQGRGNLYGSPHDNVAETAVDYESTYAHVDDGNASFLDYKSQPFGFESGEGGVNYDEQDEQTEHYDVGNDGDIPYNPDMDYSGDVADNDLQSHNNSTYLYSDYSYDEQDTSGMGGDYAAGVNNPAEGDGGWEESVTAATGYEDRKDSNYKLACAILSKMAAAQSSAAATNMSPAIEVIPSSAGVDSLEPTPEEYAASIENASECDSTTISAFDDGVNSSRFAADAKKNPRWQREDWQMAGEFENSLSVKGQKKASRPLMQELDTVHALINLFVHRKKSLDSNDQSGGAWANRPQGVQNNFPRATINSPRNVRPQGRQGLAENSKSNENRNAVDFPIYRGGVPGPRMTADVRPLLTPQVSARSDGNCE
jgi:hypothetical protein